jgi:AcrR family transcriptional regulator
MATCIDNGEAAPAENNQTRSEQILDIACRLFGEKGFDRTSLRDISDAAGITKAALYYHFPDKESLHRRVVLDSLKALIALVRLRLDEVGDPLEQIRTFFFATTEFYQNNASAWTAGSNSFWSSSEDMRAAGVALRDELEAILRDAIRNAVAAGTIRPVDPALVGRFLLGSMNHVMRWHSSEGPLSMRDINEQYLDFALNGLKPRD